VAGTVFDFTKGRRFADGLRDGKDQQIVYGRGYDHNFALDKGLTATPQLAARLEDPASGRVLEVLTTEPGVQVYTGNFLDGTLIGKQGHLYRMGDGIALEPQKFPDRPTIPISFPRASIPASPIGMHDLPPHRFALNPHQRRPTHREIHDRQDPQASQPRLVRQPRQHRHDLALSGAIPELRPQPEELRSGKPIIGIAQTGSDLSPCNRHHLVLAERIREGIRERAASLWNSRSIRFRKPASPTAGLDRNLAYLALVEALYGYPLDGVVLTTGCDKTTPALLMAAATVNIPAIALSVGPMLNGWHKGERTGSGTIVWKGRQMLAAGEIDDEGFIKLVASSAPSTGYCNTMGTATTMNSLAEALGMMLPGRRPSRALSRPSGMRLSHRQAHRRYGA
jgi:hypothetical protein